MSTARELSVIIPTCPPRLGKLQALLEGIASSAVDHDALEVVLVVDDLDDAPVRSARALLPASIRLRGLTQRRQGPARARNLALQHAQGRWVLIYDDDALVNAETIPGHWQQIRRNPDATVAYLGRTDWPPRLIDSPWRVLLASSPMLFFWDSMRDGETYGFRHFWTSNISVRSDLLRAVGGFDERFPDAMHEDIELGWRLERQFGLRVQPVMSILSWHDHPLSPEDYFRREYRSGKSAAAAREINAAFYYDVWGRRGDPQRAAAVLRSLFMLAGSQVLSLFQEWAVPSPRRPSRDELRAAYLAHLPLKRMMFFQGYLGRQWEELWDAVSNCAPPDQRLHPSAPERVECTPSGV